MRVWLMSAGALLVLLALLRWLPGWLLAGAELDLPDDVRVPLAAAAAVLQVLYEAAMWPLLALAVLLGPIVVVEDCGAVQALRQWAALLRQQPARALLHEAGAVAVAAALALPLLLPVELAALAAPVEGEPGLAARATLALLRGLALTPAIAYLAVANVLIYLTLRYEHTPASGVRGQGSGVRE
jgi:hypothetical protein